MNDEAALLQSARRLDNKALTKIFDTYASTIYNYVMRLCHNPVEADNIVGDVFVKLLDQFAAGQGPVTNLKAYLFQIAYHCVVDAARHDNRLAPLEVVTAVPSTSQAGSVVSQVEEHQMMEAFQAALDKELTEIQRHVVILRFMEDFSLRETATIVGKEVNHVKVIQNRGVAKLRKCLGSKTLFPDGSSRR